MKILVGIPTYHRSSAPALAEQLSRFIDRVVITPTDTKIPLYSPSYFVKECSEKGISCARNVLLRIALEENYDIAISVDDDIKMSDEFLNRFIILGAALIYKGMGSFTAKTRLVNFWDGECISNKEYEIRPRMAQLFMLNMKAVKKIGEFDPDLELFEDLDYSLRLVKAGFPTAQWAKSKTVYHHTISRHGKSDDAGGFTVSRIAQELPRAIEIMNEKHSDLVHIEATKESKHRVKFNMKEFAKLIPNLGLGYEDKRGIRA